MGINKEILPQTEDFDQEDTSILNHSIPEQMQQSLEAID
jgi:hypothetical protein